MEKAVFITKISALKERLEGYSRVYFGNEFCRKLIPANEELADILDSVLSRSLKFTFVTGFVTDADIDYLQGSLDLISAKAPGSEIVINDWGMLDTVKKHGLSPVVGRLLTKQRRDPRIMNLLRRMPRGAAECVRSIGGGPSLIRFLKKESVGRMEIDNLPQGIAPAEDEGSGGIRFSLYFPFNYLTTSRECIFNGGDCGRRCRGVAVTLEHRSMPLPLYMKGNTIFLENSRLPDNLLRKGIDRIVYQPAIPM